MINLNKQRYALVALSNRDMYFDVSELGPYKILAIATSVLIKSCKKFFARAAIRFGW